MSIIGFWILFFYTTFCGLSATAGDDHFCDGAAARRVLLAGHRLHLRSLPPHLARKEIRPPPVLHPARDAAGAELRAHVGRGPELLVLPDHVLLLRARVRDGDHPVRNAGRGDVARLPDQGEVRGRAHPLRADREHRGDVAARRDHRAARRQGIGGHVPLPRRDLLGVLRVRGARRVPVHLGAAARGDREHRASRRSAVRRSM